MSITLTVAEIVSLADFAGIPLDHDTSISDDEAETEITIEECPEEGLSDQDGDDVTVSHFRLIAYNTEYPEEGSCGLGPELSAVRPSQGDGGGKGEGEKVG